MPSTDFDGSVIVILSTQEARSIFDRLMVDEDLSEIDRGVMRKIARDLKLEYHE